ncbi:2-amino-4-hydroxy-6-hydroxymethyldihydropteridine diphosphokinase [Flexibacterium corallicola]|uniref:2-amino-4-hydroxy-6- hydroxymethyldihydropteridine diphosphokinase n=1 Tax=Flexibacterium corallicola TaxID=3037259 RepID=UPI00286F76D5|nr:2-amino-4-hydroxy-6-hydroxymethyldihydropteridine diphosphokinase [Pseudovibrio sp. M1P-2-3]
MKREMITCALGLGSNLGDSNAYIKSAISILDQTPDIEVIATSSHYRTPPWGPVPQDDYRNCCVTIRTSLSAQELLRTCLGVEEDLGRTREERWGPRTIDIDLLLYGDQTVQDEGLEVPHPRMAERAFVLIPLAEIWPDAHIGNGLTVQAALKTCPDQDGIYKLQCLLNS